MPATRLTIRSLEAIRAGDLDRLRLLAEQYAAIVRKFRGK